MQAVSFSADDQQLRRVTDALQTYLEAYGYTRIETPLIQPLDLFLTRAGDQIVSRLFTFERLGQPLALRPEFTATAAYHYAKQHHADEPLPVVRWQFSGPVFEDTAEGSRSHYQRYNAGAELIGMPGRLADAEMIALAALGLAEHGLDDWEITIGHVGLLRRILEAFQLDSRVQRFLLGQLPALRNSEQGKRYVLELLETSLLTAEATALTGEQAEVETVLRTADEAEIDAQQMLGVLLDATQRGGTMGGRTRQDIVRRLVRKRQRAARRGQILEALDFLVDWSQISGSPGEAFTRIRHSPYTGDETTAQILLEWERTIELVQAYGVPAEHIRIQPHVARGWEYYTGVVFELHSAGLYLGGGGRYDELVGLLGGHDAPAVGFVYDVDALLNAIPPRPATLEVQLILVVEDGAEHEAVRWSLALRAHQQANLLLTTRNLLPSGIPIARIQPSGSLEHQGQHFTLDDLDALLSRLKQV